ncbi:DNA repair protein RadC [Pseudoalteromonas xiamenensis]|uniref:RadC family protein n=1 Tax=Pseudoalteromonas xiamenensis TaxID=882626 RepID=UPI0027E55266|nr:DNA repair protein RadC [Pseudoalteromonas xiamenensis]WMN61370.1 DNA repair protein RadC [Pseudoalteromonas xiamenensis]
MHLLALPKSQRPREKLLNHGPEMLSDAELLAIFLRTGIAGMNAIELAETLLRKTESLHNLFNATLPEFAAIKGMGEAKYVQLQAVLELCKRYLKEPCLRTTLFDSPDSVRQYLTMKLRGLGHEVFVVLYLDNQNRLIKDEVLFQGTINAASVYPREVVKAALKINAASLILAHNHPSGVAEPSQADKLITKKLQQALGLIDVQVLDHLIVAGPDCLSFAERGLI